MGDSRESEADLTAPLPAVNPRIAARVVNGETLILTPHDSVLHTLNGVATRVWELMGPCHSVSELAAAIASEYETDEATAREDVLELLAQLRAAGILQT